MTSTRWGWYALLMVALASCSHYHGAIAVKERVAFVGNPHLNDATHSRPFRLQQSQVVDNNIQNMITDEKEMDTRPHEQRATKPRTARRLNHAFRYLFRHDDARCSEILLANLTSVDFLIQFGGYTEKQVYEMNQSFPPLLGLDVKRHLWPKLRFLQETIGVGDNVTILKELIPPQYFGARLERTIAPRHAFLVYQNLPHGQELLQQIGGSNTMWHEFLLSCRKTKQFCALCNKWRKQQYSSGVTMTTEPITAKQIEAFDVLFQRGLMAAARDELCQSNNTWPLTHVTITSGQMISLLVQHGANPLERDVRGTSLLHWAAGTGNLEAVKMLFPHFAEGAFTEADRDGATPLHWAAAGAKAREFGCGGHLHTCRYFLEQVHGPDTKRLIHKRTKDGNSVLMWAAWSGTLDVVKLLIRNRADAGVANRNGCTVAHWASSGGNLAVCRYLAETVGVDFTIPNYGGNTPLTHAVAFGRVDVVEWLRNEVCNADDSVAAELAKDFVGWTEGDSNRQQILNLFEGWFGHDSGASDQVDEEELIDSELELY